MTTHVLSGVRLRAMLLAVLLFVLTACALGAPPSGGTPETPETPGTSGTSGTSGTPGTTPLPQGTSAEAVILLYHHFSESGGENAVSAAELSAHLDALADAGYEFVRLSELIAFVQRGEPLPARTAVLMADDGYQSVLDVALPIAQARGIPLTAAPIGISDGRDTYRDTGIAILPHFSAAEAAARGVCLVSHSFDGHMGSLDAGSPCFRDGLLRRPGESAGDYEAFLRRDWAAMADLLDGIGDSRIVAYPFGLWSDESEAVLRSLGVVMTLTTENALCRLRVGDADCLFRLPRLTIDPGTPAEALLARVEALCSLAP